MVDVNKLLSAEGAQTCQEGIVRDTIMALCSELPEEVCLNASMVHNNLCEDEEVSCGNGQCVRRTAMCDGVEQCHNGMDERQW